WPAIVGAPVGFAARLERAAPRGGVLIGRDAYRQLAGAFEVEAVMLPPSGGEEEVRAYRVRGRVAGEAVRERLGERHFIGRATALVGRAVEMESLGAASDAVLREAAARMVALVGPAGIGKSRVLA